MNATAECPVPVYAPQAAEQITDWYAKYVAPLRALTGIPESTPPGKEMIEALVDRMTGFHRRGVSDPLFFEPLVQKIAASYARAGDFKGLTSAVAEKLYRSGAGTDLDFSALCIDTRRDRFPDDTFAITLFGVNYDNCQHVFTHGLVFTGALVNGNANGECRPDYAFYRMIFIPVSAGTNSVTFICIKDAGGCLRH